MNGAVPRVAVVGTGSMGAMALWRLAARGVDAVGFDTYAPGHDRGAAGGQTRIFRTAYREGPGYVPLLRRAERLWRELESDTERDLLTLSGGLTIGLPDDPDVRTVLECAERFRLDHELLDRTQVGRRFPEHPLRDGEVAVLDRHAGVLRPEPAVTAAAVCAERLGAQVHRYQRVHDVVPDSDRVVLRTDRGVQVFDQVVLAPGPWATDQPLLDFARLEVHQITTYWFPVRSPERYAPQRMPIVIRCGVPGYSTFPTVDGETVKLSVHHLQRPRIQSAEQLTRNGPQNLLEAVRDVVPEFLPGLLPDPVRIGAYADCFAPDGHGLVGRLPDHPNVVVLAGFSGHGFKLSPVFGDLAADMVLGTTPADDITHLNPDRFR